MKKVVYGRMGILAISIAAIIIGIFLYKGYATQVYMNDFKSENIMIKSKAIFYLGEKKEADVVPGLIEVIGDRNHSKKVRLNAIEAIGKIYTQGIIDELFSYFKNKGDETRRQAAKVLVEALEENDLEIRLAAIDALGKIKDASAVKHLLDKLNDKDAQSYIIRALGNIGDNSAVPALTKLLNHPDKFVTHNVSQALKKIKGND